MIDLLKFIVEKFPHFCNCYENTVIKNFLETKEIDCTCFNLNFLQMYIKAKFNLNYLIKNGRVLNLTLNS